MPIMNNWKSDNWTHLLPEINVQGRVTSQEVEFAEGELEEAQQEKLKSRITEMLKPVIRLNSITHDKSILIRHRAAEMLERVSQRQQDNIQRPGDREAMLGHGILIVLSLMARCSHVLQGRLSVPAIYR